MKRAETQLTAALGGACDLALLRARLEQLTPADVAPSLHDAWQWRLQQLSPPAPVAPARAPAQVQQQVQEPASLPAGAGQQHSSTADGMASSPMREEPLLVSTVVAARGLGSTSSPSLGLGGLGAPAPDPLLQMGLAAEWDAMYSLRTREVAGARR